MNILLSDSWLRDFLKTKATPEELKNYLSLCGPSVERITRTGTDYVYDIETTSNRPDVMSVAGVAREAAAILPRFGITASLKNDPYGITSKITTKGKLTLTVKTDPKLNPRWTSVVLSNINVGPSPSWLTKRLETTGIRSLNNVVDVSNYLMRAYGQPVHIFDYDEIKGSIMLLRESRKGEKIVTLDGKTHILPGGDIVIEDGDGRLIDLCGIMGGYNSSVKKSTSRVVLFTQTYDPAHIRKTSMALAARTEAATLFEKDLDSTLTMPTLIKGIELLSDLTGARVASKIYDINRSVYKPYTVSVTKNKTFSYIGVPLKNADIGKMLSALGFSTKISNRDITVTVPSWRRDITLDVDVIEELARIYGYHNIASSLPASVPPTVLPEKQLTLESEIKMRLRDWGFTETYSYSMISENIMNVFSLNKKHIYEIANPLSDEWVYMRPTLIPSMLSILKENLKHVEDLRLFELSMVYEYRAGNLPLEIPMLLVAWSGSRLREAKGIQEVFGNTGEVAIVDGDVLHKMDINSPVTTFYARVSDIVRYLSSPKKYTPIPKYPPIIEDFSFVVTPDFRVGPFIEVLSKIHKLIKSVTLLDAFENKRTFRVTYLDPAKTLTNTDVAPVHQKFLEYAAEKFGMSPVI